ncbi:MAG TPA: TetR family transcriptional regulator [Pseudonocardia sp.]|nr:TetR family transcriptional regulator [Pseudonocardia sp.]
MPVPAGEPRLTAKGARTRLRIVAAAAELMNDTSVAGTTVEQVRDAAGVSSSQIYHYFADKQALVKAVIAYQNDTVVGGQEALFDKLDTLDGLRAWRDAIVELQRQRECRGGCPMGTLGSELAEIDAEARADLAGGFIRWAAGLRRGYQAMYDRGDLVAEADPGKLATATLAALQGGLLLTQLNRDTEPLESALDVILDHVRSLVR